MSKTSHILCIAAGHGAGQYAPPVGFHPVSGPIGDTIRGDLWIGHRPMLETLKPVKPAADHIIGVMDALAGAAGDKLDGPDFFSSIAQTLASSMAGVARPKPVDYPRFLQVIPHYLLRNRGRYLRYLRTTTGGDARLHGKIAIGIGGHVDLADVEIAQDGSIDLMATVLGGGAREAKEEVALAVQPDRFRWVGTIYATETEVDTVHLGLVAVCELTDEEADGLTANHEIGDMAFRTFAEIQNEVAQDPGKQLETWARLIIESNPLA